MIMVIADLEMALDERGYAVGGPQMIMPAVRGRSLGQQAFQRADLLIGQGRRPMRMGTST